jgi:hypothetical protein
VSLLSTRPSANKRQLGVRGSSLLLVLFALAAGAARGFELETFEIDSPWNGIARPGTATEIQVKVESRQWVEATLMVSGRSQVTSLPVQLAPETLHKFSLPILAEPEGPIQVTLRRGEEVLIRKSYRWEVPVQPRLAAVATQVPLSYDRLGRQATQWLPVDATALPDTPAGYRTLDLLIIDTPTLSRMTRKQQAAFEHFLADCGRTIAVGMSPDIARALRRRSGCEHDFFRSVENSAELARALADYDWKQPPPLPNAMQLRSLVPDSEVDTKLAVAVFTIGFFLLTGVTIVFSRRIAVTLLTPVLLVGMALVIWYLPEPRISQVTWAERDMDNGIARFSSLLVTQGNSFGDALVSVPYSSDLPIAEEGEVGKLQASLQAQPAFFELELPGRLLARSEHFFTGTLAVPFDLQIGFRDSSPFVANKGKRSSPKGWLIWQGATFELPRLKPGQEWQPRRVSDVREPRALGILRQRAPSESVALLVPFPGLDPDRKPSVEQSAWLMLSTEQNGPAES